MRDGMMRLAGAGFGGLLPQVRALVDDLKERAAADLRQKAVNLGLVVALVLIGAIFAVLTVLTALVLLYVLLAQHFDRPTAIAIVGGVTAVLAAIFIGAAAYKAKHKPPSRPETREGLAQARAKLASAPAAGLNAVVDSATATMRTGSREAVLGTVAAAVVLGIILGRRS